MGNPLNTYNQKGLVFPFNIVDGKVAVSEYRELIIASILNILRWPITTLGFSPTFGSRLEDLIGEQNTIVLGVLVRKFLQEALTTYESRISILDLTITMPSVSSMHVIVKYQILATAAVNELEIIQSI